MHNNNDRRKIPDRRTQELKLSYDRRVRPDRRLGNIIAEWISLAESTYTSCIKDVNDSFEEQAVNSVSRSDDQSATS